MRGDFEMGGTPIADALYEGLRKRTGSANRCVDPGTMEEFFTGWGMDGNIMEPEKLPPLSGPGAVGGGTVLGPVECKVCNRGLFQRGQCQVCGALQHSPERHDPVNHPAHYKQFGVEVIDIIRNTLGPEGFRAYCIGNELKYRLRAGDKGDASQDIAKAMKYREFREANCAE